MAHKIGLVLLASMHLMNAQVLGTGDNGASSGTFGYQTPVVSFLPGRIESNTDHHDNGPLLGLEKVAIGNSLLKEANKVGDHGDRRDVKIIQVIKRERSLSGRKNRSRSNKKDESRSNKKDRSRSNKKDRSRSNKKDRSRSNKKDRSRSNKREEKRDFSHDKPAKVVLNVIKQVQLEHKVEKKEEKEYQHKPIDVNKTPVHFKPTHYIDNDKAEKAPISIVTVPLIADNDHDPHRVARNENIGRANYHQIKGKDAPLNKYDDLLKVKVEGPIKNLEVHTEQLRSEISVDKKKVKRTVRKDTKEDKIINARLRGDLIDGNRLEKAPFVVGKVVLAETKREYRTDDHHGRYDHDSHTYTDSHSDTDSHRGGKHDHESESSSYRGERHGKDIHYIKRNYDNKHH